MVVGVAIVTGNESSDQGEGEDGKSEHFESQL